MGTLTGANLLGPRGSREGKLAFRAENPTTGASLDPEFTEATAAEIDAAATGAARAFDATEIPAASPRHRARPRREPRSRAPPRPQGRPRPRGGRPHRGRGFAGDASRGPWPATTDARATSVGTAAILRFARPVCYQNVPEAALPEELRGDNPRGIWRLVDG